MLTVYHNGECSKCRGALEIIQESGIPHEVRWYLHEPLSKDELKDLLQKLSVPVLDLIRTGEEYFQAQLAGKSLSDDEWLDVLAAHPELMQRPIVVNGNKALIARPPERVHELLG